MRIAQSSSVANLPNYRTGTTTHNAVNRSSANNDDQQDQLLKRDLIRLKNRFSSFKESLVAARPTDEFGNIENSSSLSQRRRPVANDFSQDSIDLVNETGLPASRAASEESDGNSADINSNPLNESVVNLPMLSANRSYFALGSKEPKEPVPSNEVYWEFHEIVVELNQVFQSKHRQEETETRKMMRKEFTEAMLAIDKAVASKAAALGIGFDFSADAGDVANWNEEQQALFANSLENDLSEVKSVLLGDSDRNPGILNTLINQVQRTSGQLPGSEYQLDLYI